MQHPEVAEILDGYGPDLKRDVKDVIAKTYTGSGGRSWLSCIVTSQFDADRLDYMMRDSHMTGVKYGRIDLTWLLRNLVVEKAQIGREDEPVLEDRIVIDVMRGLSSLEEYLLGNLYLYEHVYHHKTVIAAETLVVNVLTRAIDLLREGTQIGVQCDAFVQIAENKEIDLSAYCDLDDTFILSCIRRWAEFDIDPVLQELSNRILHRDLFKVVENPHLGTKGVKMEQAVEKKLKEEGLDTKYYYGLCDPSRAAYKTVFSDARMSGLQEVFCRTDEPNVVRFSELVRIKDRPISKAIKDTELTKRYIVVPESHKSIVDSVLKGE